MNSQCKHFLIMLISSLLILGCSTTRLVPEEKLNIKQSIEQRNQQLLTLNKWQLKGKIAFLQTNKRESASINWKVNNDNQQLNLSTYLGISVLKLTSNNGLHTINLDGKKYQSSDLETLIYSLTQLTLPVKALSYWLKGLPYQPSDHIDYHPETQLPKSLNSQYDGRLWQIKYSKYKNIKNKSTNTLLATKITISQGDLTIKIAINNWTI